MKSMLAPQVTRSHMPPSVGGKPGRLALALSAAMVTAAFGVFTTVQAHPIHAPQPCSSSGGAANSRTACAVMPSSGAFTLPIPGTGATLVGTGTPDRAGKPIEIQRVPLICPQLGGFGIRITTPRSAGLLPPLRWATGTLYARNSSTGVCSVVTSPAVAAAPGSYQVVAGTPSGVANMPRSGAGRVAFHSSAGPSALVVLGLFALLLGALLRRRFQT